MNHMSASSQNRPPITKPITSRGQQTRQKLLDAAEEVFGERGYERASIVDITRRAGVAQGTFYVYFADKKAIFVELVRELSHRLRGEIAKAVAGLSDRMEIERVGFRTFFTFAHEHRNLYKIVRQAEFVDEELFRWYYRRLAEGYARGLAQAMEAEQIRRLDPECLAYCLMGIADFLGMRWVLWDGESPPDEVFENMMAFIRYGMELRREAESKETKGGST
ncbi:MULTISPECIES: TetR/AcrR family transcriptional regulator [Caldilinea]|jgi:AcrR family transcriptional regulator|nr:MAG: TetR family transcriptional regulator [Caldilinea sp.]